MNKKKSNIERLKSIAIVVLFLNSILLLYFFWEDVELTDLKIPDFVFEEEKIERTLSPKDVLEPSYFLAGFSGGEYTIVKTENDFQAGETGQGARADVLTRDIARFMASQDIFAEAITEAQYDEVFDHISVRAVFDYALPFEDFCACFEIQNSKAASEIELVSEIGYSDIAANNLFIYDKKNKKYCRLISNVESTYLESFFGTSRMTEDDSSSAEAQPLVNTQPYYNLDMYLGKDTDSHLLLPIYLESDIESTGIFPDFPVGDESALASEARKFFGNTIDFVRKIEEMSGRTIYMYGYAERMLTSDIDGSIEYKDESAKGEATGYIEALDRALYFIEEYADGMTLGKKQASEKFDIFDIYLDTVVQNPGGKKGYRFEFGMKMDDEKIFMQKNNAIVLEVTNGEVSYFYKSVPRLIERESSKGEGEPNSGREVFSAINTLAANYEYIYNILRENEVSEDSENALPKGGKIFEQVAEKIGAMEYGYLRIESELIPVWRVEVAGIADAIYFDLYTAEPIREEKQ